MRSAVIIVCLVAVAVACRRGGPDPSSALPADAGALVVVRSIASVAERLGPILDRMPEGEGAADLVRSLTGFDLRRPAKSLESGLDPDRPIAAAWWHDAVVIILPVSDDALALRRLGLRLARLGFGEADGAPDAAPAAVRAFVDRDQRHATLRVGGGLAFVCVGAEKGCVDAGALAPAGGWSPADVTAELALGDADVAGIVRNPQVASLIRAAFGKHVIPPMMLALLGDLRWAVRLDHGVRTRVALGATGTPLQAPADPVPAPPGTAFVLTAAVPPALAQAGLATSLLMLCGAPCQAATQGGPDPSAALASWTGQAGVALLANPEAPRAPLLPDLRMLARLKLVAATRFGNPGAASTALDVLAAAVPQLNLRAERWPDPARPGVTARGGADLDASATAAGDLLVVASSAASAGLVRDAASGGLGGLATSLASLSAPGVLRAVVDPSLLVVALGGAGVEFVQHLLGALRLVSVDAAFQDARVSAEVVVVLR